MQLVILFFFFYAESLPKSKEKSREKANMEEAHKPI